MTRWEELGMTAEEYFHSRWKDVEIHHGLVDQDAYGYWATVRGRLKFGPSDSREDVCKLAAKFTAVHEEAIKNKREEVKLVHRFIQFREGEHLAYAGSPVFQAEMAADAEVFRRILAVLEGQLAELLKGWKNRPSAAKKPECTCGYDARNNERDSDLDCPVYYPAKENEGK